MPRNTSASAVPLSPTLDEMIAARAAELTQLLAAGGSDPEQLVTLLRDAMHDANDVATEGAISAWAIEWKGQFTQGRWTRSTTGFGYGYPTLDDAKESCDRDMRDAGHERNDNADNRYRIIPLTIIEGAPIAVRHKQPEPGPWPRAEDD